MHDSCSFVAVLHYTFLQTCLLKSIIMVSIIILILVLASNIQQGSVSITPAPTPPSVDVNKAPIDDVVDGLYICVEGATGHGKIAKEQVEYWNKRHPLNFIVETLVKELPRIFDETVFKSLLKNQATVFIAGLELCRPTIHGYSDAGLQTVLKLSKRLADQIYDETNKAGKLIENSVPYQTVYDALKKTTTTTTTT